MIALLFDSLRGRFLTTDSVLVETDRFRAGHERTAVAATSRERPGGAAALILERSPTCCIVIISPGRWIIATPLPSGPLQSV